MILLPPRPPLFHEGDKPPGAPSGPSSSGWASAGFGEVWKARHDACRARSPRSSSASIPFPNGTSWRTSSRTSSWSRTGLDGHPNIVKLKDIDLDCEAPWLQFEYVAGGDLGQLVSTWPDDVAVRGRDGRADGRRAGRHAAPLPRPEAGAASSTETSSRPTCSSTRTAR